jgi:hypothetical protein
MWGIQWSPSEYSIKGYIASWPDLGHAQFFQFFRRSFRVHLVSPWVEFA